MKIRNPTPPDNSGELDPRIVQIIGFATSEAFETGRDFKGTWANSPLIYKYGWQVQDYITSQISEQVAKTLRKVYTDNSGEIYITTSTGFMQLHDYIAALHKQSSKLNTPKE